MNPTARALEKTLLDFTLTHSWTRMGGKNSMTPTQRSLEKLRSDGYSVAVVERWSPATVAGFRGPIIRKDVWNFADLLACKIGVIGATLVQVTTGDNHAARLDKIKKSPEAGIWLAAGNRICLHSFSKKGKAGKRKLWTCREVWIQAGDLNEKVPLSDS